MPTRKTGSTKRASKLIPAKIIFRFAPSIAITISPSTGVRTTIPPGVEYTLDGAAHIRLDEIKLINGSLDITGVAGEVHASCINGKLEAHNLSGRAELSTINGHLDAQV